MLIDSGMAQGYDAVMPMQSWPISSKDIQFLLLTHAHLNHICHIRELVEHGFKGEILCTYPTHELIFPLLKDALSFTAQAHSQKKDVLERIDELTYGFEHDEDFSLKKGIFSFHQAGYSLGSAFIRLDLPENYSIFFSGYLGSKDTLILCAPDVSVPYDLLVFESTYGDRLHGDRSMRIECLGLILARCLTDNGKVFIPAFAQGRTQEHIYEMNQLTFIEKVDVPIYVDSPLGLEITRPYHTLAPYWDREAKSLYTSGEHPMNFKNLHAALNHEHHQDLVRQPGPMIVLAGSGMCIDGRIVDYLRHGIEGPVNEILFVEHQSNGTLGAELLRYGDRPGEYMLGLSPTQAADLKFGIWNGPSCSRRPSKKMASSWPQ